MGDDFLARWRRLDELRGPRRLVPQGLLVLIEHPSKEGR